MHLCLSRGLGQAVCFLPSVWRRYAVASTAGACRTWLRRRPAWWRNLELRLRARAACCSAAVKTDAKRRLKWKRSSRVITGRQDRLTWRLHGRFAFTTAQCHCYYRPPPPPLSPATVFTAVFVLTLLLTSLLSRVYIVNCVQRWRSLTTA